MSADTALMELHRQLDADVAPYLRLALSRGEGLRIGLYIGPDGKIGEPERKPVMAKKDKDCINR